MDNFLTQFGAFMTIATAVVIGAVAVYGLWDKRQRDRRIEVDKEEDRLIKLLEKTVGELSKKVTEQDTDIKDLKKKVDELERENNLLVQILQGRDEETKKFYKRAYETFDKIDLLLRDK